MIPGMIAQVESGVVVALAISQCGGTMGYRRGNSNLLCLVEHHDNRRLMSQRYLTSFSVLVVSIAQSQKIPI